MLKTRPIRDTGQTIESIPFVLKHVLFAMRPVWRGSVRIDVSSPAKTIIDPLMIPRSAAAFAMSPTAWLRISIGKMPRKVTRWRLWVPTFWLAARGEH